MELEIHFILVSILIFSSELDFQVAGRAGLPLTLFKISESVRQKVCFAVGLAVPVCSAARGLCVAASGGLSEEIALCGRVREPATMRLLTVYHITAV